MIYRSFQGIVLEVPIMLNFSLYRNLSSLKIPSKKTLHTKNWVVTWKKYLIIVYDNVKLQIWI